MKRILETSIRVLAVLAIVNTTTFVLRKGVTFAAQQIHIARFKRELKKTLKEGEIAQLQDEDGNVIKSYKMIDGKVTEIELILAQE